MANIPPSFSFKGDRQKSISLKAQARQFYNFIVNQAELGGIPFINRSLVLSDGSVISVISKKESIYGHRTGFVTIFTSSIINIVKEKIKLYLESGFIELRNIAPCNQDTYRPSALHYNSLMGTGAIPWQGELTLTEESPFFEAETLGERDSLSTGCQTRIDSITKCDVTYDEVGAFCDGDEIRRLKTIQARISPSNFTGELCRYVQAIYGSNRRDYSTIEDYPLTNPPLFIGAEQIHYSGTPFTSGIVCGSNYTYFLVKLPIEDVSSIEYSRLIPSDAGLQLRDHLIAHEGVLSVDDKIKIRSYLLSTCTASTTSQIISVLMGEVVQGQPAAYGWKFNSDGSKADIILHRDNLPTDQAWHAYHYRLEFLEADGVLSATLSTVSSDNSWYSVANKIIWTPDYLSGQMTAMVNPKQTIFSGWDIGSTWSANIYCYYNKDDELVTINAGNVWTASTPVSEQNLNVSGELTGKAFTKIGAHTRPGYSVSSISSNVGATFSYSTMAEIANAYVEYFFGKGLDDWEAPYPYGLASDPTSAIRRLDTNANNKLSNLVQYYTDALATGYMLTYLSGMMYTNEGAGINRIAVSYNQRHNLVDFYQATGVTDAKSVMHVLFIPHGDCSAVLIGEKKRHYYSETTRYQQWKNGKTNALSIFIRWKYNGGVKTIDNIQNNTDNANRIFNQDVGDGATVVANSDSSETTVVTDIGELLFNDQSSDFGLYGTYFECNWASDPSGYFTVSGNRSIGGASRIDIQGLCSRIDGYEYDTAVGWA